MGSQLCVILPALVQIALQTLFHLLQHDILLSIGGSLRLGPPRLLLSLSTVRIIALTCGLFTPNHFQYQPNLATIFVE